MRTSELLRLYPRLFHMAAPDAWPGIQEHGLLSTQALLDLFEIGDPRRTQLLSQRRAESVSINHPEYGTAVVRDQKPLSEEKLASCLHGYSVAEWLRLLNGQVFFWLQPERLTRLLTARAYRGKDHLVITVETKRLLDHVPIDTILLSRINSGSTVYTPVARGTDTFHTVEDYPHPERRQARKAASDVAELCVKEGVPDIVLVAETAKLHGPSGTRLLWSRSS